jgi:PE-PPE domain-containing protein/PE family protein
MSYLVAVPDVLASAATDVEGIGSSLTAATAAAAVPTTAVAAAGADEVSSAIAALFSSHAQAHQALSAEAAAFHAEFVRALTGAATAYAGAEAGNVAPLQNVVHDVLDLVNAPGASAGARGAAADVALIMGPSGFPVPPLPYLDAANKLYVQVLHPGATPLPLTTPEGLYPVTGISTLKLNNSVAQGVATLNNAILQQIAVGNHVDVFGYSQSSTVSSLLMSQLAAEHVPPGDVSFILVGDPSNPNGGFLERFVGGSLPSFGVTPNITGATPSNLYPTSIYTKEYDGFADFPQYPINFLSDLNAYVGIAFDHTAYVDLTPQQISGATNLGTYGTTTYYMIPTNNLPLLEPLRWIPFGNPLADLVQPDLTVLVDLGYGSTTQGWSPGPPNVPTPFGLFPTNVGPADVVTALAQGIPQGFHNAITDLQTGQLMNTSSLRGLIDAAYTFGLIPSTHPTPSQLLGALPTFFNADVPPTPITLSSPPADVVNVLTSVASTDVSTVLPLADTALALGLSAPTYDASLFLNNLATGNLLAAVGDPIAADVALLPFLVVFGALPVGEALVTTAYDLVGGLIP